MQNTYKMEKVEKIPYKQSEDVTSGVESNKRIFQYIAAFSASLATVSTGAILGWPSQIISSLLDGDLDFSISEDELGWVTSATQLGAALLSLVTGGICDKFGRKLTMLTMASLLEIGWCLMIFANSVWMLTAGRFITGMVGGAYCVSVPLYIHEIADKEIRGSVGCFTQLMISVGILFSNIFGMYVSIKELSIACAILPIIFVGVFVFMPESPIFLIENNRFDEATKSLQRLHSKHDVFKEIENIKLTVTQNVKYNVISAIKRAFGSKATKAACGIALGLAIIKVFTGIDPITAYLSHIFEETHVQIGPDVATTIFSTVQIVSTVVQALIIENFGRKILLISSELLITITLISTGVYLTFSNKILESSSADSLSYIPLILLCFFNVAFSFGIGPIGWSLGGEIFPNDIKGKAMSVYTSSIWLLAFGAVKGYQSIQAEWNSYVSFFIFGVVSAVSVAFIIFFVPETKNKTYEEIEKELDSL